MCIICIKKCQLGIENCVFLLLGYGVTHKICPNGTIQRCCFSIIFEIIMPNLHQIILIYALRENKVPIIRIKKLALKSPNAKFGHKHKSSRNKQQTFLCNLELPLIFSLAVFIIFVYYHIKYRHYCCL